MEDTQVVDVLNVTLLELGVDGIPLASEMQGVQGLGLCFADGWNVFTTWQRTKSYKVSTTVLERYSSRSLVCCWKQV